MTAIPSLRPTPDGKSYFGTLPDEKLEKVLEVKELEVVLGGKRILHDVDFWIPKGEFLCLCGPNGAGKSTLLKTILGRIEPTKGSVRIHGKPASEAFHDVGYVPQRKTFDRGFPATALELVVANLRGKWPLRYHKDELERARAALKRVGGEKLADKDLAGLSGGETQRVFLARAMVRDPQLIILDEPTAGVDVKGRAEFLELLAEISASDELAAILVTHNLAAISRTAERVLYLDRRVVAWGLPGELLGRESLAAISMGGPPGAGRDHAALPGAFPDEE
jgi:ABC-type Mn2+/Zn2+ transport system ATPase subunit